MRVPLLPSPPPPSPRVRVPRALRRPAGVHACRWEGSYGGGWKRGARASGTHLRRGCFCRGGHSAEKKRGAGDDAQSEEMSEFIRAVLAGDDADFSVEQLLQETGSSQPGGKGGEGESVDTSVLPCYFSPEKGSRTGSLRVQHAKAVCVSAAPSSSAAQVWQNAGGDLSQLSASIFCSPPPARM